MTLRWTWIERAPCADGEHHTSYLLVPAEPGHVTAFPEHNFRLTSAGHRETLRQRLAELGLVLDLE